MRTAAFCMRVQPHPSPALSLSRCARQSIHMHYFISFWNSFNSIRTSLEDAARVAPPVVSGVFTFIRHTCHPYLLHSHDTKGSSSVSPAAFCHPAKNSPVPSLNSPFPSLHTSVHLAALSCPRIPHPSPAHVQPERLMCDVSAIKCGIGFVTQHAGYCPNAI